MPQRDAKKKPSGTVKLTVTLTKECRDKAVETGRDIFGKRSGAISMYVEMILRMNLHMGQKGVEEV